MFLYVHLVIVSLPKCVCVFLCFCVECLCLLACWLCGICSPFYHTRLGAAVGCLSRIEHKKNAGNSQLVAFLSLSFTKLLLVCVCFLLGFQLFIFILLLLVSIFILSVLHRYLISISVCLTFLLLFHFLFCVYIFV